MSEPSSVRLGALFRLYAADLARTEAIRDTFRCPLCVQDFRYDANRPLDQYVAEEHVVPEALGGRIVTLTCRRCNNSDGSALESDLIQRVRVHSREAPVHARVEIGGSVHRAELHVPRDRDEPFKIIGIKKQSDPRQVEEAQRQLTAGCDTMNLKINFGYSEFRSQIALLRAAYLLMFRVFGYSYVRDSSAEMVRMQIMNRTVGAPVLRGLAWSLSGFTDDTTLCVTVAPKSFRSFVALLKLNKDPRQVAGVVLPPPGSEGTELYESISESQRGPEIVTALSLPSGFVPFLEFWQAMFAGRDQA